MSFKNVAWRVLPYSQKIEIGSDWQDKDPDDPVFGLYTKCGFWTKAETEFLKLVVRQFPGEWLEIGAHTGWCTNAIMRNNVDPACHFGRVTAIEPMFSLAEWYRRFVENLSYDRHNMEYIMPWAGLSEEYFKIWDGAGGRTFNGVLIDGDHAGGNPLKDAQGAYHRLRERAVVLLHDFRGPEVWDAAQYLVDQGLQWKIYPSVHMIAVCWRGDFDPPPLIQEAPDLSDGFISDMQQYGDKDGRLEWARYYGLPDWAK